MATIYLLLGSNQGDREYFLTEAANMLSNQLGDIIAESAVYETAAWGLEEQPSFLNQALVITTDLNPLEVLSILNQVEQDLGRVRIIKWGARVIDIDIIYYDDLVLDSPTLCIPHPRLQERSFVLIPLVEVAPEFVHPVLIKNNAALLQECPDTLEVKLYKKKNPS